ncbi:MAG: D-tyrosyl-tRNA(Tyr) deacylase [Chloroflexi bacterium]|nr:D-tyrosyl-tRNA(Tyr) deacylase [Chloroflexota bacterium]MCH8222174.1 D-tyrosyl-tRNA(Tyr) deacylase [Chloroflexota bacterium]
MRAVIQRVSRSSVSVDGDITGSTERGLTVLLGVTHDDEQQDIDYIVDKTVNMRLFPHEGEEHGFERSVLDIEGSVLLVSQFTLYASTRKGRRPSFMAAAPGEVSGPMFDRVVGAFRDRGVRAETGLFGAYMQVELVNDGPVTIILDSQERNTPRRGAD